MILDNSLMFTGRSNGETGGISSGAYTDVPTTGTQIATNIIDLGLLGIPLSANGGGARDMGVGDYPSLKLMARVISGFANGSSLQLVLAGAPDNGSGAPGTYTTMWSSGAIALAQLTQGARLANVNVPRPVPGQALPRFLRLSFVSVGTFTGGGAVEATIVIDRDDQIVGTTGAMSGYPAGINIAN